MEPHVCSLILMTKVNSGPSSEPFRFLMPANVRGAESCQGQNGTNTSRLMKGPLLCSCFILLNRFGAVSNNRKRFCLREKSLIWAGTFCFKEVSPTQPEDTVLECQWVSSITFAVEDLCVMIGFRSNYLCTHSTFHTMTANSSALQLGKEECLKHTKTNKHWIVKIKINVFDFSRDSLSQLHKTDYFNAH